MKVTEQDVAYVADLANLELTESERRRMVKDLNSILEYVGRLNELDTTHVEPMAQTSERYGLNQPPRPKGHAPGIPIQPAEAATVSFAHALRGDVVHGLRPSLPREDALRNAPQTDGIFFKVPKVIER